MDGEEIMTTKEAILQVLEESDRPLAIFEFGLMGVAQTSISARLRELRKENKVYSVPVKGQKYTKWLLTPVSYYSWDQPQAGRRLLKELDKQMIQDVAECEELGIPYWVKGE